MVEKALHNKGIYSCARTCSAQILKSGLDPYEFQEINYRSPSKIKIEETQQRYKVAYKKEE